MRINGVPGWVPFQDCRRNPCIELFREPLAERAAALKDAAWLWDFAKKNRMESIVAHALADGIGFPKLPDRWRQAHDEWVARMTRYMGEVDRVAEALAREGIALVALKNVGIARGIHRCAACCPMGDIDVLVDPVQFPRAHEIMVGLDYKLHSRNPQEKMDFDYAKKSGGAEYFLDQPGQERLWFELQWRPVAGRWLAPGQEPDAATLLGRSVPIPGTSARLLSPEDNLLQVSLHTAKHTFVRAPGFRLHFDVHRVVGHGGIDWDRFLARVYRLNVRTPVFFSLAIPKMLFGTPIPERVIREIEPPSGQGPILAAMLNRAGLFDPDVRKFSKFGYLVFASLLYDTPGVFLRSAFPPVPWLRQRYGFETPLLAPVHYARRLYDLAFRHIGT